MIAVLPGGAPDAGDAVVTHEGTGLPRAEFSPSVAQSRLPVATERQADPALFAVDHPSLVEAYGEKYLSELDDDSPLKLLLEGIDANLKTIDEAGNAEVLTVELHKIQVALKANQGEDGNFAGTRLLDDLVAVRDLRVAEQCKESSEPVKSFHNRPAMFALNPFIRLYERLRSLQDTTEEPSLIKSIIKDLNTLANDLAKQIEHKASDN